MRKKTQKEFEDDVKFANPYIEILGQYVNNATRIRAKCKKCGRLWDAVPTKITIPYTCPLCERQEELCSFLHENKLVNLDSYEDNFKRIRIKCNVCGYEWKAVPKTIKKDARCPICYEKGKKKKWTEETFSEEMNRSCPTIELMEAYKGYEEKYIANVRNAHTSSINPHISY